MERFILRIENKPKRKRSKRAPGVRRAPPSPPSTRKKTNERKVSNTATHLVSPRSRSRSPLAPPAKAFECRLVCPNPSRFGFLLLPINLLSLFPSLSLSSLLFILRAFRCVFFSFVVSRKGFLPDERKKESSSNRDSLQRRVLLFFLLLSFLWEKNSLFFSLFFFSFLRFFGTQSTPEEEAPHFYAFALRATPYNTHTYTTRTSKCRFSLRYARRRLSPLRRSRCPTNSESPAR